MMGLLCLLVTTGCGSAPSPPPPVCCHHVEAGEQDGEIVPVDRFQRIPRSACHEGAGMEVIDDVECTSRGL